MAFLPLIDIIDPNKTRPYTIPISFAIIIYSARPANKRNHWAETKTENRL